MIDEFKLQRDYKKCPIIIAPNGVKSEKPFKNDLKYLYLDLNMTSNELSLFFKVSLPTVKRWLSFYNLHKSQNLKLQKIKITCLQKYGKNHFNNREKSIKTCLQKYGVKNVSQVNSVQLKKYQTMTKNHSFGASKEENIIYKLLCQKYENVKRQYKSEVYPFACDFYIPIIDTYIEYQGFFTHGSEPYDENNPIHQEKLKLWKSKNSKFYNNAIICWTKTDMLKRKIAKNNNLNWIEFFNIDDFNKWILR